MPELSGPVKSNGKSNSPVLRRALQARSAPMPGFAVPLICRCLPEVTQDIGAEGLHQLLVLRFSLCNHAADFVECGALALLDFTKRQERSYAQIHAGTALPNCDDLTYCHSVGMLFELAVEWRHLSMGYHEARPQPLPCPAHRAPVRAACRVERCDCRPLCKTARRSHRSL
jgi:hypothetical protein